MSNENESKIIFSNLRNMVADGIPLTEEDVQTLERIYNKGETTSDLATAHITISSDDPYELGNKIVDRLDRIITGLDLPTEDEVYEEALKSRTRNTAGKMNRLADELEKDIESVVNKAEEIMKAKMELNVLQEELGSDYVIFNTDVPYEELKNYETPVMYLNTRPTEGLKYVGTDLLKAYAQLKAVFDIDNERPDPSLYSEEKLNRLVNMIATESGMEKWEKWEKGDFKNQVCESLKKKELSPEGLSAFRFKNPRPEVKDELLAEYTKYYNSDQQL